MGEEYIKRYFENNTWLRKENANQYPSFSNLKGFIANETLKSHTLAKYPEEIRKLHLDGDIHIHDLSNGIIPYCSGIDFLQLLNEGLKTERIVSAPPKHLDTALNQLLNRFMAQQQEWAGAQAANDFNTLLAPFVVKDKLSYDEVKQAIQRFIWDCNYPTRGGWETAFTNVMFNTKCPNNLVEIAPLHFPDDTYADFHDESLMILEAFNSVIRGGDHNNNPFTFPIPTINLIKSTNFNDDIWYKISETVARYGTYYFMNFIGSGIEENSVRAMCCRIFIDYKELADSGGRWAMQGSTGSIGVVTINTAKLGYLAKDDVGLFSRLDQILEQVKESLLLKEKWCVEMIENGYLPITNIYGIDFDRYFRTIGVIGLNEMCVNFLGLPLSSCPDFAEKVLTYIREWTRTAQVETKKLWNLEMTPGEGASTRLAFADRKQFPDIYTQGTLSAPYYTTVIVPTNEPMELYERVKIEENLLQLFSGGTVFRYNIGEYNPSPGGMLKLTERLAKNTKIPYFDWAKILSICQTCGGRTSGVYEECPICGKKTKIYARIVGYYSDIDRANVGKLKEILERRHKLVQV